MKKQIRILCAFLTIAATPISITYCNETAVEIESQKKVYPVVILGGGTGALTSALYLARAGLEPLVLEGANPGGLITQSHSVQNWPGELEISGMELADKLKAQALANGAQFKSEVVTSVDFSKRPFTITTSEANNPSKQRQIVAEVCIIAMGTQSNYLQIPGESGPDGYWGRGVSNCAICDGSLYRDQIVGIVGGGDAAVLEGLYLSNIAKEVNLFVRKESFKAIEEKRLQTLLSRPNVKVFYDTTIEAIRGDQEKVTHARVQPKEGEAYDLPLNALFLAIGSRPNTQLFENTLKLDENGYIILSKDQETLIAGVYAIGDIVDPVYKQAISAAGDGAKAAIQAQKYLSDRENGLIARSKKSLKETIKAVAEIEVIEISSQEQFDRELRSSQGPVFVDFYANWCGPCRIIAPLIEGMAGTLSGKVKFLKVNVDTMGPLSSTYRITSMPTALVIDSSGSVIERKVGTDQISDLLQKLETESK